MKTLLILQQMTIKWNPIKQIPPGMYARSGKDPSGDPHILMAAHKEQIEKGESRGHDHYWKREGKWYVQIRLTSNASAVPSDNKGHLFGPNRLFEECPTDNLDNLLKQL